MEELEFKAESHIFKNLVLYVFMCLNLKMLNQI